MAVRRQVYVWNHRPDGFLGAQAARGGNRPPTTPASVFTGPYGTSNTVPAITSPTQFVVIEHISSSPGDSGPLAPAAPDPMALPGNIPVQSSAPVSEPVALPGDPRLRNAGIGGAGLQNEMFLTTFPYLSGTLKVYANSPGAGPAPYSGATPIALGSTVAGPFGLPGAEVMEQRLANGGPNIGRITGSNSRFSFPPAGGGGVVGGSFTVATGEVGWARGATATNYLVSYIASTAQVMSGGSTQMQINTTGYYQTPDGVQTPGGGVPGEASPYPASQLNQQFYFLSPNIYVLQGQTWDLLFNTRNAVGTNPQVSALGTQVFCRYVLYDGPDSLISSKLLEMGITVTPDNVDWYKKMLIEQQQRADLIAQQVAKKKA